MASVRERAKPTIFFSVPDWSYKAGDECVTSLADSATMEKVAIPASVNQAVSEVANREVGKGLNQLYFDNPDASILSMGAE